MKLLTRAQVPYDTSLSRRGTIVDRSRRKGLVFHHTVTTDNDTTKNEWENLDEVRAMSVRMQTIRPDLGLDVPYNFLAFPMSDGDVAMVEGRGEDRSGAHTKGHNIEFIAVAWVGDFENRAAPARLAANMQDVADTIMTMGFPNMGSRRPSDTREVFGHRDVGSTSCPGKAIFGLLGGVTLSGQGTNTVPPITTPPEGTTRLPPPPETIRALFAAGVLGGDPEFWIELPLSDPQWRQDFFPALDGAAAPALTPAQLYPG